MKKTTTDKDAMGKPYVVCHMLTSLDGKIDGAYMGAPECAPALTAYGNLRGFFQCEATLYGTTTMAGSYSDGFVENLPVSDTVYPKEDYVSVSDAQSYIISVDPKGVLGFHSNFIEKKGRPKAHVVEVLTEAVTNDYLAYLREHHISYVFAGKEQLDCGLLLDKLQRLFSIDRLMTAGGGLMNWTFIQENLIDELSLLIAPVADGNTSAVSIFEQADFLPEKAPVAFQVKEVQVLEDNVVWLRYLVK